MKNLITLLLVVITVTAPAIGRDNALSRFLSKRPTTQKVASNKSDRKADTTFEYINSSYAQGRISADSIVSLALYHKAVNPQLAERCLRLAVESGNPRALAELGLLYTHYTTAYLFPGKAVEGVNLLERAAKMNNSDACDYLGIYYHLNNDFKKARKYFEDGGHKNNVLSLPIIGAMYEEGTGYKKDPLKALEYYRRGALQGDRNSASKYGYSLQRQRFGTPNLPDAFFWMYIAGDLGNDAARSNLWLPLTGERFGDDFHTALARKTFEIAEKEHKGKRFSSQALYKEGFLVGIKDREKAAEQGDDWSRFYLGSMNYNDDFLNRNYAQALRYYEAIAKSDKLPAPVLAVVYERLGDMYRNGKGTKVNLTKANAYTRKAASYGSAAAYKLVEK